MQRSAAARARTCACAVADAPSCPSAGAGLCRCGNPAAPSSSGRALPWNREARPSCRASNLHARDCQLHGCTNWRDPRAATTTDLSESNSPPRACVRRPGQRRPQRSVPLAATGAPVGPPPHGGRRVLALAYTQISGKTIGLCIVSQQRKSPQCCLAAVHPGGCHHVQACRVSRRALRRPNGVAFAQSRARAASQHLSCAET